MASPGDAPDVDAVAKSDLRLTAPSDSLGWGSWHSLAFIAALICFLILNIHQKHVLFRVKASSLDVAAALAQAPKDAPVLIDCATLWLTNVILGEHPLETAQSDFLTAITSAGRPIVVVSNETGQGIVPENALARKFRNAQGRLNQAIAAEADLVVAVMAGLPMVLKGQLP